jgi:cytochrome P450
VTSEVVGLTNSDSHAMAQRIRRAFTTLVEIPKSRIGQKLFQLDKAYRGLLFYWFDVRPAVRARRKKPRDDVLSQIIAKGYSREMILLECRTYGSAGMMTTREFIVAAAWHLLEDISLSEQFLTGGEATQFAILEEILRIDPVVTYLHRRATEDFVTSDGQTILAGNFYAIDLRAANIDETTVGANPQAIDIDRAARQRMTSSWMSFGDGPHRCPGAQLALHETRVFLDALLRVPGIRLASPPIPRWTGTTYELHGAFVECERV